MLAQRMIAQVSHCGIPDLKQRLKAGRANVREPPISLWRSGGSARHKSAAERQIYPANGCASAVWTPSGHRPAHFQRIRERDVATDDAMMASVAGRYAAALFDLASEQKALPQIEADLSRFQGLLDESADLRQMVRSPVISSDDQGKAIAALAVKAGIGPVTTNFLQLIARNRRLFAVEDMVKGFRALAAKARGEVTAEVTSAVALTDAQVASLKETLKASAGKDVALRQRVEPGILGGLVVKMGSKMIDSSLRTKLTNMKVALKG